MDIAFLCRFGHQDIFRLLGRDPQTHPLTPLEFQIFVRCVQKHWVEECKARARTLEDDGPEP